MNKEQLRMQMLAGIITEGQYKKEVEEIEVRGKIGKSYPSPGSTEPSSTPPESPEGEQLRKKGRDLYEYIIMHKNLSGDDYLDAILKNSISDDTLQKIADENGGSLGSGMHKIIKSKFLPIKELKEVIRKLENASNILKKSKNEVDFYYYGWDKIKEKWYDARKED